MNPNTQIRQTQPQLAQLELMFCGPLLKDAQVSTFNDLLTLPNKYHYEHKLIWVKSDKSFYYLANGDGTASQNWQKQVGRVVIVKYSAAESYQQDDTVYLSGKIYKAKQNVPIGTTPLDNEAYWLCIAGETETYRYIFDNKSSVLVYTEIRNPSFQVIVGTFLLDGNGIPTIGPDGLVILQNQEIVDATVIKRDDLSPDNGIPYEIQFESEGALTALTGAINIK